MIAPWLVLAERLRALEVGKTMSLKGRALSLDPEVDLVPEALTVERLADGHEPVSGKSVDVRRYRLKLKHKNGSFDGSFSVDAAGHPVVLEIENNMGTTRYQRVE